MKRDKCVNSYSCGLSCITKVKKCKKNFPPKVQEFLDSRFTMLKSLTGDTAKIKKELTRLAHFIDVNERGELVFYSTEEGKTRILSFEEIQGIKKQRELLEGATTPEGVRDFVNKAKELRSWDSEQFSEEEVETLFNLLPYSLKRQLNAKGGAPSGSWYPEDKRGIAVLSLYLSQGGRDAYSASERVFGPGDLSIEHITPLSAGGKDSPDNWVLVRRGSNEERKNIPYSEWIKTLPDTLEEWKNVYVKGKLLNRGEYEQLKAKAKEGIDLTKQDPEYLVTLAAPRALAMAFGFMRFLNPLKPVPKGVRTTTTTPQALVRLMLADVALTGDEIKGPQWLNDFYHRLYNLNSAEEIEGLLLSEFPPFPDTPKFNKAVTQAVKALTKEYRKFK